MLKSEKFLCLLSKPVFLFGLRQKLANREFLNSNFVMNQRVKYSSFQNDLHTEVIICVDYVIIKLLLYLLLLFLLLYIPNVVGM